MAEYKFNPEQYGFEPVDKFPELAYNYPMGTGKWFIKISEYGNYGRLVYWYHAVFTGVGLGDEHGKVEQTGRGGFAPARCHHHGWQRSLGAASRQAAPVRGS